MSLNKYEILKSLDDQNTRLTIVETTASTNDYLKPFFSDRSPQICIAEQQTQGKGSRLQRNWHSPIGVNIYLSLLYPFQKPVRELEGLSLVVGLALTNTLNSVFPCNDSFLIKWPNDIFHNQKKLAGILVEMGALTPSSCSAIIGVGINVNMMPDENIAIAQPWTSLKNITKTHIDRNYLCAAFINQLFTYLKQFENVGLISFLNEWNQADYLIGKLLKLKAGQEILEGIAHGITHRGYLKIKLADGSFFEFSSAEVNIMKSDTTSPQYL